MLRKLGIKRSFHCENLSSIVGLDRHAAQDEEEDELMNSPQKRSKRRRSISTEDSSSYSCSAVCYCCSEEEGIIKPANFMPATSSDGSLTPVEEGKIMPTKFITGTICIFLLTKII